MTEQEKDFYLQEFNKFDEYSPDQIIAIANEAILKEKTYALAYKAKAMALNLKNEKEKAIENLFLSLHFNQEDVQTFFMLGHFLAQQNRFADAVQVLKEAIRRHPADPLAYAALANALYCHYAPLDEIIPNIENALLLQENEENALNLMHQLFKNKEAFQQEFTRIYNKNLMPFRQVRKISWQILKEKNKLKHKELLEKALSIMPNDAQLNCDFAMALHQLGQNHDAIFYVEKSIELCKKEQVKNEPDEKNRQTLFRCLCNRLICYPYTPISAEKMGHFARDFAAQFPAHPLFQFKKNGRKKRLKIGFLSADLRNHVVVKFFKNFLTHARQTSLDFYAYSTNVAFDEISDEIKPFFRRWQNINILNDEEAARLIHQDKIDILFDLSGLTIGNRLNIFRYRPAPIGVTWIGWLGGVGVQGIDYIISSANIIDCQQAPDEFFEKPLILPECWICFSAPENPFPIWDAPLLKNKWMTLGAVHNLNKLTDETIQLWAEVLKQNENTRFIYMREVLQDENIKNYVYARFEKYAIPNLKNRLLILANQTQEEYFSVFNQIDFILDTFPASSGTTAVEAAFMGVPSLTLRSELMAGKLCKELLCNLNLPQWVAQTPAEFVDKASDFVQHFSRNPQELNALRHQLRPRLLNSPMCDAARFVHHFEQAMWQAWHDFEKGIYPQ